MEIYDLVILGGGPAGYNAAYRAAAGGMKTAVIEKRALGGVCLNEGCVPSKALLNSAKIYDYAKHGADYGVTFEGANLNQEAVIGRKNKVVASLVGVFVYHERMTVPSMAGVLLVLSAVLLLNREAPGNP